MKTTNTAALLGLLIAMSACTSKRTAQAPTSQANPETTTNSSSHQHAAMSGGPGGQSGMHHGSMHEQMAGMHDHMSEHCPMRVEGATVTATDTEAGVALVFTTSGDVTELRRRVAQMAVHKNKMMGEGCSCCAHDGGMHGQRVEHSVQVVEVTNGAQLVFTPKQSADLPALRDHVKAKAKAMQDGKCPMMKGHGSKEGQGQEHQHGTPPK